MKRLEAAKNYKNALKSQKTAEMAAAISLTPWIIATERLAVARRMLVVAEMAEPTPSEIRKQNELLRHRNRGLE